jgi:cytochrome c biogenesis protein CcdA
LNHLLTASIAALWLGILTAISPCPLTTNIAAVSFIGRRAGQRAAVLTAGLLYALGRTVAYIAVAFILIAGLTSIPALSWALQKHMHVVLGPLLVLTGMIILELIALPSGKGIDAERTKRIVDKLGMFSAFFLGIVFALAFCPTSAALYFGSLIPLALDNNSPLLIPGLYGIGTALPVVVVAVILAFSAEAAARLLGSLASVELWARRITGVLMILIGVYLSLHYIFGII